MTCNQKKAAEIAASKINFLEELLSPIVTPIVTLILYNPYFC